MEDISNNKTPEILELVDVKFMQNVQDFLAKTLDVALVSVYDNNWLTDASNTIDFCRLFIRRNESGNNRCSACHRLWEDAVIKHGKPMVFTCHTGLTNFAVPVMLDGKYLACVIGGQVLTEHLDEKHFKKVAEELEITEKGFMTEMKNIKILSVEKITAITDLLFLITNSVVALSYTNTQLKKLGLDYKVPNNIPFQEWFLSNCGKIRRPISSREFEVLKLIVQGKNNNQISKEMFISVHTVKAHVSSIIEKLQVEDRVQAAVKAIREGLI